MALTSVGTAREWRDSSGQHSRDGEFVAYRDGRVIVRLPDGRQASAPLERLSAEDQAYVRNHGKVQTRAASEPAVVASRPVPVRTANFQTEQIPDYDRGLPASADQAASPSDDSEADVPRPFR